jgi:glycosyltransferase involved in cell wall biosynthesis
MASAMADLTAGRLSILHVISGLTIGGAESMLAALAASTAMPGVEHRVVSLKSGGPYVKRLRAAGVPVDELGFRSTIPSPRGFRRLITLIRDAQPDIVQGWLYHGDLAALLALALSGRRRSTRLIWSIRCSDMDWRRYGWRLRAAVRLWTMLSSWPDIIVANSEAGLASHVARGCRPRRTAIIPNGIDLARFGENVASRSQLRRSLSIPEDAPLIAHVARVDPMKDHRTMLAALGLLPGVHCLAIGAGTESLPTTPNLHLLGSRSDLPLLLSAADLIVSSSEFGEGFSNALAEGMAAALPAVATDVGAARDIIGDTGIVVPPRDPGSLAAAIATLLAEDAPQRHGRGERARRRIGERFSLAQNAAAFAKLYRDLASSRGSGASSSSDMSPDRSRR